MSDTGTGQQLCEDVSLVIPTVGRAILRQCLAAVAAGTRLPGRVIVVDQSSSPDIDTWLDVLRARGVQARHLPSGQTGRAAGVNRGIEAVGTGFLVITDDDCMVDRHWLEQMRRHLGAAPERVVTGRVESGGDETVALVVTSRSAEQYDRPRLKFDRLSGGNMGAARAVFDRVGLLDEDPVLRCSEDGEWAYRALRAGVGITYAPDVIIHHHGWRDSGERRQQYRQYALSSGGFYGKYLRHGDWFIGLRSLVHLLRELRRLLKSTLTGNTENRMLSSAYLRGLPRGMLAGLGSRRPRVAPGIGTATRQGT